MPAALRAMSMLDVAGSAGQYAYVVAECSQSTSHLIAVRLKVLLALANDIIQQPSLLGTKLLCSSLSVSQL
jgi:hypothetical protein